ncbi:hypothetical protein [Streptomyces sp. NPDC048644]|uniref:hypothetical protein n=1 Tax=Streptomyces sp. NPDC048644 TaxID=3365582 RepID=UPI0037144FC6
MSIDSNAGPAAVADAQLRGHLAALAVAEQVIRTCPQLPDSVTTECHSWSTGSRVVQVYFHSSKIGVAALARALAVRTTTEPHSTTDPRPYTSLEAVVDGVQVHAWTLTDAVEQSDDLLVESATAEVQADGLCPWRRVTDTLNGLIAAGVPAHIEPDGHISNPAGDADSERGDR